jgi:hypothetical protein
LVLLDFRFEFLAQQIQVQSLAEAVKIYQGHQMMPELVFSLTHHQWLALLQILIHLLVELAPQKISQHKHWHLAQYQISLAKLVIARKSHHQSLAYQKFTERLLRLQIIYLIVELM